MAIGAIIGGLIGRNAAAGDRGAAMDAMRQAVADIEAVGVPTEVAKEIVLNKYQDEGLS